MRAASLNFRDLIVTKGGYARNDRCPVIPLTADWEVAVRQLTDDRGVDNVIELGGPGTLAKS